jgi:hypothetical protein
MLSNIIDGLKTDIKSLQAEIAKKKRETLPSDELHNEKLFACMSRGANDVEFNNGTWYCICGDMSMFDLSDPYRACPEEDPLSLTQSTPSPTLKELEEKLSLKRTELQAKETQYKNECSSNGSGSSTSGPSTNSGNPTALTYKDFSEIYSSSCQCGLYQGKCMIWRWGDARATAWLDSTTCGDGECGQMMYSSSFTEYLSTHCGLDYEVLESSKILQIAN